jgi:predicted protein tyrosine phosphatase
MIWASSHRHLADLIARLDPSHVLTLLAPTDLTSVQVEGRRQLLLRFNDIDKEQSGLVAPTPLDIENILSFGRSWDDSSPLLIHCWAGISRSSAAAFIIACDRNPGCEREIAIELRQRALFCTPNRLMIALADDLLSRDGRMIDAISHIGRGADAFEGTPYELPSRWPLP